MINLQGGDYMQGFIFNVIDENITNFVIVPDIKDGITTFNWRLAYKIDDTTG